MNWFLISLIGPLLWALVNHIDKYIISKYFTGRGVGSLVIFTGASGFLISLGILIFRPDSVFINFFNALFIAINGAILVVSFIPYLYALEDEEASWASSLFQLIPIYGYFLALIFLGEKLTLIQIIGSILVIIGAIIISTNFVGKIKFKLKPFLLMSLSSFLIALNALIFKIIAIDSDFVGVAFWEYIGGAIFGLGLFSFSRLYREQFIATIAKSRTRVLTINLVSELLNIGAKLAANFASLLAPLVLVWVVNGLQPMFVLIYGIIITLFMPHLGKEDLSLHNVIKKVIAMIVIFIGIYLLFV